MNEIKTAYRQMALLLHPDRHDGDEVKTQAFKDASDAYSILSDNARRRQYDMAKFGGWSHVNNNSSSNGSRRPNYRKVYSPHAPPDGKWHDAQRHYDMHYGDGMYREEIKRAQDKAKERGEYNYHSPLGKGFSFGTVDDKNDNSNNQHATDDNIDSADHGTRRDTAEHINGNGSAYSSNLQHNPYSKAAQGPPPPPMWLYEEGYIGEAKTVLKRKTGVTERLYARREARKQQQEEQDEQERQAQADAEQAAQQQQQQERTRAAMSGAMNYNSGRSGAGAGANNNTNIPKYEAFNQTAAACSIM